MVLGQDVVTPCNKGKNKTARQASLYSEECKTYNSLVEEVEKKVKAERKLVCESSSATASAEEVKAIANSKACGCFKGAVIHHEKTPFFGFPYFLEGQDACKCIKTLREQVFFDEEKKCKSGSPNNSETCTTKKIAQLKRSSSINDACLKAAGASYLIVGASVFALAALF